MSFAATGAFLAANASWIIPTTVAAGSAALGYASSQKQGEAAQQAAQTQADAAQAGIAEQQRQFDAIQKLLSPYVQSGTNALAGQNDLLGLNGDQAQQQAISALQSGSQFQALNKAGSDAILSNAAATGGLRGGNVQGALANNSQNILNSLIQQRFSNLGSLSSLGQNAAAGVGNAGQNTANQVSSLLQQQGAATAGGQLANNPYAAASNALGTGTGAYYLLQQLMKNSGTGGNN